MLWREASARSFLLSPQLTNLRQLTFDGREKYGLESDGHQLYFGEHQNGWTALVSMPPDGGEIHIVWNPPMNVVPQDISPNGKALLALTTLEIELEGQIWIVPLDRRAPYRLGNFLAHSAAWSPDGQTIAFANGESIYLASTDGMAARVIGTFSAVPSMLHWSDDGARQRIVPGLAHRRRVSSRKHVVAWQARG